MRKLMEAMDQAYVTKKVVGHEDRESHMMQRELLKIRDYASELLDLLDNFPDGDFPHWWQAKLVKAGDYMSTIKHFLEGEIELENRKQEKFYVDTDELQDFVPLDEDNHDDWNAHTQSGGLQDRYQAYIDSADDGEGNDVTTGGPLKSFDEWLNS